MIEQLSFDPLAQRYSVTSVEAADRIKDRAPILREQVLQIIRRHGPITDELGAALLNMPGNTYRPRRRELDRMGLIRKAEQFGITASGRRAVRWMT